MIHAKQLGLAVERYVTVACASIRCHVLLGTLLTMVSLSLLGAVGASALTTVPAIMNFQGRLTTSAGSVVTDGTYNMQFRVYDAASGGTLKWSEERLVSDGKGVPVINGLFAIKLGEGDAVGSTTGATPLDPSIFGSGSLYLEVTMAQPANATTNTASGSMVWESPMTPRNQMATSAYAYNAETLDGRDSSEFAQLAASNTWTGIQNVFKAATDGVATFSIQDTAGSNIVNVNSLNQTVQIGSNSDTNSKLYVYTATKTALLLRQAGTSSLMRMQNNTTDVMVVSDTGAVLSRNSSNSTNAFQIQNAAGTNIFNVDTTTAAVTVGTAANGVISSASGIQLAGTARATRTVTLAPEFAGATFTPVSANFNGSLSSDFCSSGSLINTNAAICNNASDEHNYYAWTTTQAVAQDYGIFVRYQIPSDYDPGSMTGLSFWGRGSTAGETVGLTMYKGATACTTVADIVTSATTWTQSTTASPLGACSINPDDIITFKITMSATQNNAAQVGEIRFTYRSKF